MTVHTGPVGGYIRSALFVDFDNVYIGLDQQESAVANAFATQPGKWVDWLEKALSVPEYGPAGSVRRILYRRCYLNPRSFGKYRAFFIRNGFATVDCPVLTAQGKTSADVYMVLDIVDLLSHETRFDEFILLSADADFTPVLLKLRKHDRRTGILAIGPASSAYTSAADMVIDQDEFVGVLGASSDGERERDTQRGQRRTTPIPAAKQLGAYVRDTVSQSGKPLALSSLAQAVRRNHPSVGDNWAGCGSFSSLLDTLDLGGCKRSNWGGGYLYDPARHTPPGGVDDQRADAFQDKAPELAELARRVSQVTDAPYLRPDEYAFVFKAIADDVNGAGNYKMATVSRGVRDICRDKGLTVGRQQVNFILRGIAFAGHRLGQQKEQAARLAEAFRGNVKVLCNRAQLDLDDSEEALLERWIRA